VILDCLDRENSLSPVFKIESGDLHRRDAILIRKQQFVDSKSDDVIDPQILQVHTAVKENTYIHLAVHNKFYNNSNSLVEYSFFFTFLMILRYIHSEFMEPSDFLAKFAIWNRIMRTFFTHNHSSSSNNAATINLRPSSFT